MDWASWDDTYNFIEDKNRDYIDSNLVDGTFINLRLNIILYYDSAGKLVFGKAFDHENCMEVSIPSSLLEHLTPNSLLLSHSEPWDGVKGLINLPEAPLLISSRPITRSDGSGPIRGFLIMGRYLNAEELRRLAEVTNLKLEIKGPEASMLPALLEADPEIMVQPLDDRLTVGYSLLRDIYGKPGLILTVTEHREIYAQGLRTVSFFIASSLATGLLVSIMILKLLDRMILSRLSHLSQEVENIEKLGDPSLRVQVSGEDEISSLAGRVNSMLERLELSQETIRRYSQSLEELVEEKTRELIRAERMAAAGEVSAMVAHDLKSPLQTIRNAVYTLRRRPEESESLLKLIDGAVEQAATILEDLHRDIKETRPGLEATDLGALIRRALEELHPPQSISTSLKLGEGLNQVPLDASRFRRVLDNLLKNSIEAMPNGGDLTVSADASGDEVIIRISDTGRGIPEEALDNLFKPFSTTKPGGLGLGLAYCKRTVEAHGGRITVDSRPGEGTTFTITIPRWRPSTIEPPQQP
ncbi:HAMP domain-containing protein [Candidatus Bathyarchaeota archaeon]|nr:HAMP domain-containing protein [Candidatus Bathyarchaeota archaeon]